MRFRLLICAMLISAAGHAQSTADSMVKLLPAAKEDSNKAMMLYNIGVAYSASDLDRTMLYAREGLSLSAKIKWDKGLGFFYYLIGAVFMNKANYDSALFYHNKSYEVDQKLGDRHGTVADLINIGLTEVSRGNSQKAMEHFMHAMPVAEEVKDSGYLSLLHQHISNVYLFQKDYAKAKSFSDKAFQIAVLSHQQENQAHALAGLGTIAHEQNDTLTAMGYYNRALQIYRDLHNDLRVATLLGNIGILQTDKRKGIEYKLKALALWDSISPSYPDAIKNTGNLGLDYLDIARYDTLHLVKPGGIIPEGRTALLATAEKYLQQAVNLSKEAGNMEWYWVYAHDLGDLYEIKGDFKQALLYNKVSTKIHDSLYSQENKNKIASLAGEREIALRDREIALNRLTLSAQKKQRIALICGIALLIIIGLLLYRQSRLRKRNNEKLQRLNLELDEANKIKARFFAILSHDLRSPISNLVSFLELQQSAPEALSAERSAEHRQQITAAAGSLLDNMEAMLIWSKEQMENFEPSIRRVFVSDLFDHIRKFFAVTENVRFDFSDPGNLDVQTDENYLQTIMHNLTSNAIKALKDTPDAMVKWEATIENKHIVFTISDNGPGISESKTVALNDSITAPNAATGFGFHLVRDLAKAIQCEISVKSEEGQGTAFTLRMKRFPNG